MSQDIKRPALPCFVLMFSKHAFPISNIIFVACFFHYFDQSSFETMENVQNEGSQWTIFNIKNGIYRRRREYAHYRLSSAMVNVT